MNTLMEISKNHAPYPLKYYTNDYCRYDYGKFSDALIADSDNYDIDNDFVLSHNANTFCSFCYANILNYAKSSIHGIVVVDEIVKSPFNFDKYSMYNLLAKDLGVPSYREIPASVTEYFGTYIRPYENTTFRYEQIVVPLSDYEHCKTITFMKTLISRPLYIKKIMSIERRGKYEKRVK